MADNKNLSSPVRSAAGLRPPDAFQAIYPGATQVKAFTGTSAQSTAVAVTTSIVRLLATEDCFVLFGANPTALTSSTFIKANMPEYFGITPGNKIAVIRLTNSGNLYITEGGQ